MRRCDVVVFVFLFILDVLFIGGNVMFLIFLISNRWGYISVYLWFLSFDFLLYFIGSRLFG